MVALKNLASAVGLSVKHVVRLDWRAIERSLGGTRLPADYRLLVESFPDGRFRDLIKIIRPGMNGGSDKEYLGYFATQLDDMRGWREDGDGEFPYPIFPETGGVLPWGQGPAGELFFWLTDDGDPDHWPTVWADRFYAEWHRYDLRMSEVLLRVVLDTPPEIAGIAAVDLAASPPFRSFETLRSVDDGLGDHPAEPAGSGRWLPQNSQEERLQGLLDGARADAAKPRNAIAALLSALELGAASRQETDWAALDSELGISVPEDYRTFIDALGPGVFCDIRILGPGAPANFNLTAVLQDMRSLIAHAGMGAIVSVQPEPGGLIPWGYTLDGYIFCWKPAGPDAGAWSVATVARSFLVTNFFELSFSSFLLKYSGVRDQRGLFLDRPDWTHGPTFTTT